MRSDGTREHFGPDPHDGSGPEMIHKLVHERAIGKTIASVYLGDDKPIRPFSDSEVFQSEYLAFEFTDGSSLVLQVAAGNSFHLALEDEARKILASAKRASKKRLGNA